MDDLPQSEETIFAQALELGTGQRSDYLDRACAGNAALRARVEALLRSHDEADSLLDAAPGGAARTSLTRPPPEETPGILIDRYKLLQKIGEGGCGVVYMAEQEEPVRRRVALKVIKLGMDTREVVARFEAERQALALMDHPNIARVFDGGATATGRPYFVMELVRGIPITTYCDEQSLSTPARLGLFMQVCQAVQHAHQKGIIHRDLKPSNILVTVNDGAPVPKVIDFGIAKATQGRLTDRTLFTAFEQFIGTPAYMSPEQAELTSVDVDTRSDIYSLGVLLYELLTGQTPFDAKSLLQSGLDEIRRVIREVEPPRPSARLSTLTDADRATVAKLRATAPMQLSTLLRGDLDWIVMRCLEKDRRRRYESAGGLALDLQRHLQNEPVSARPPSTTYRLQKLVARNKLAVGAIAAVVTALVAGLAVSTTLFLRERRTLERARTAEQRTAEALHQAVLLKNQAELRRDETEAINRFLTADLLGSADPEIARGRDLTVKQVLDNAATRVAFSFRGKPGLEAALRHTIGSTYVSIGAYAEAESHLGHALEQRRRLLGAEHPDTLLTRRALGNLRRMQMKTDEAEQILREVFAAQERILGLVHEQTLGTLFDLQTVLAWTSKETERLALVRRAWEEARVRLGPDDLLTLRLHHLVVIPKSSRADISAEVLQVTAQLLAAQRRELGDRHPVTVNTLFEYAVMLHLSGRQAEAEPPMREALALSRELHGPLHLYTAGAQQGLAEVFYAQGRSTEGEALLREAVEAARAVPGAPPAHSLRIVQNLWTRLTEGKRHVEAAGLVRGWLEHVRVTVPPDSSFPGSARTSCLDMLGRSLVALGNFTEAEDVLRESLALRERDAPNDYRRYLAQSMLGTSLLGQDRFAEAETLLLAGFEGVYKLREQIPAFRSTHPLLLAAEPVVQLYDRWAQPEKAAAWRQRMAEVRRTLPPSRP